MIRECDGCGIHMERIYMEPVAPTVDRIYWLCPDCYEDYVTEFAPEYR